MFKLNKDKIKGLVIGMVGTSIIGLSVLSFGSGILKNIEVNENSVKIQVLGKELTAPNFLYDGRSYIQIRSLTDALGKDVGWDANTGTVMIGEKGTVPNIPLKEVEVVTPKFKSTSTDPQVQFLEYIEDFLYRDHYGNISPFTSDSGQTWYKTKNIVQKDYSYDIKKTDSIVSPLTATVNFTLEKFKTDSHANVDEAKADENYKPATKDYFYSTKYRYDYAYQNGKWVYKGKASVNEFTGKWEESGMKYTELDPFGGHAKQ